MIPKVLTKAATTTTDVFEQNIEIKSLFQKLGIEIPKDLNKESAEEIIRAIRDCIDSKKLHEMLTKEGFSCTDENIEAIKQHMYRAKLLPDISEIIACLEEKMPIKRKKTTFLSFFSKSDSEIVEDTKYATLHGWHSTTLSMIYRLNIAYMDGDIEKFNSLLSRLFPDQEKAESEEIRLIFLEKTGNRDKKVIEATAGIFNITQEKLDGQIKKDQKIIINIQKCGEKQVAEALSTLGVDEKTTTKNIDELKREMYKLRLHPDISRVIFEGFEKFHVNDHRMSVFSYIPKILETAQGAISVESAKKLGKTESLFDGMEKIEGVVSDAWKKAKGYDSTTIYAIDLINEAYMARNIPSLILLLRAVEGATEEKVNGVINKIEKIYQEKDLKNLPESKSSDMIFGMK